MRAVTIEIPEKVLVGSGQSGEDFAREAKLLLFAKLFKKRGLVPAVRPLLEQARAGGYFLSTGLIESACAAVGEAVTK
jgi:hypothetical protein